MTRTTVRDLRNRTQRLSDLTGTTLHLSTWAPGDGYTRYSLEDADGQPITDRVYRLHEMAAFLDGAILAATPVKRSKIGR